MRGWANASLIETALEGVKEVAISAVNTPIENFGLLAEALVLLEEVLEDFTPEYLEEWRD